MVHIAGKQAETVPHLRQVLSRVSTVPTLIQKLRIVLADPVSLGSIQVPCNILIVFTQAAQKGLDIRT